MNKSMIVDTNILIRLFVNTITLKWSNWYDLIKQGETTFYIMSIV